MNLNYNLTWLLIELLIIVLIWLIAYLAVKKYTTKTNQEIHVSYLRTFVSFSTTVISIFIPLVVGLIVYLFSNSNSSFTSLITACVSFLIVLCCSIYLTSGILKKADGTEVVSLIYPADYSYKIAFGLVYMYLVYGIGLIILFMTTELDLKKTPTSTDPQTENSIYLQKSHIYVGDSKSTLLGHWGDPDSTHAELMYYKTKTDSIQFEIKNDTIIKKTTWKIYP